MHFLPAIFLEFLILLFYKFTSKHPNKLISPLKTFLGKSVLSATDQVIHPSNKRPMWIPHESYATKYVYNCWIYRGFSHVWKVICYLRLAAPDDTGNISYVSRQYVLATASWKHSSFEISSHENAYVRLAPSVVLDMVLQIGILRWPQVTKATLYMFVCFSPLCCSMCDFNLLLFWSI